MVLVRLYYFREHIIATHRKKTLLQSIRDRVGVLVSGVGKSNPSRHAEDGSEKHESQGSYAIQASDGIGAALAAGGATGLGLGIALGTGDDHMEKTDTARRENTWNGPDSEVQIEVNSPLSSPRASPEEDYMTRVGTEEQERGIVADINSFTSSPRSGAIPLQSPTSPPVHRMHFAVDVQNAPNGNIRRRPG